MSVHLSVCLLPVCPSDYVHMCTVPFSLAQSNNKKKAQALPELTSRFRDFLFEEVSPIDATYLKLSPSEDEFVSTNSELR